MIAVIEAMLLLLFAAWALAPDSGDGLDRADPDSVAAVFVARYARHDPAACDLVTSSLRHRLDGERRCVGPVRGTAPRLAVLSAQTCGAVHSVDAVVTPEGEFGKRFVAVGLERAGGPDWLVRSVVAVADCRVMVPRGCGGGG